jgi:xanthine/uracil permease
MQKRYSTVKNVAIKLIVFSHHSVSLILYGAQHYLSMAGSLVFIPLIMVPAMGGSDVRSFSLLHFLFFQIVSFF